MVLLIKKLLDLDVYKRHKENFGAIPVLCLKKEEIYNNLDLLKEQKTIIWYEADTTKEAQEMCEFIRNEFPVK